MLASACFKYVKMRFSSCFCQFQNVRKQGFIFIGFGFVFFGLQLADWDTRVHCVGFYLCEKECLLNEACGFVFKI